MNSFSHRQYYIVVKRQHHQKKDFFFFSGTDNQVLGNRYILLIYLEKLISELEKSPKYIYETDESAETSQVYSIVFAFKIKMQMKKNLFKELLGKRALLAELEFFFLRDL